MRFFLFLIKLTLGLFLISLAMLWMIFFGAVGAACVASVFLFPVGIALFGLATVPLWSALTWLGVRAR